MRQHELREAPRRPGEATTRAEEDAAGGNDGRIDGEWGFHTGYEIGPWWQVDLGEPCAVAEVRVYNRCGDMAPRASALEVLRSADAEQWEEVYRHDGTVFFGHSDGRPLSVPLDGAPTRWLRLQIPGKGPFHLDEVEVYDGGGENVALLRPATQSSTSKWSVSHPRPSSPARRLATPLAIERGLRLAESLARRGADVSASVAALAALAARWDGLPEDAPEAAGRALYLEARRLVRALALSNPLLDFDALLFVKRATGTLPHMADQYYGWWSRPGGGIYLLEDLRGEAPRERCLTEGWPEGNFLRPDLSPDGERVLFAFARHRPEVAGMDKLDKSRLPEDAFYCVFEMNVDGSRVRRLTRGRYDDFDARYLPGGGIVFLSTRKGCFVQYTGARVEETTRGTTPDSYVRCGGDERRPCAVYTLHAMDADGGNIRPLSAFENFEWTPAVAADGRVFYARWDYIDRSNDWFTSLWSTNPDGTAAQLVYGNYTRAPNCVFEARPVPGSAKLVFTGSSHHSLTGGSLALLDRSRGTEGEAALTRLTPEVCFPEIEGWPAHYFANPFPLSEEHFLVAWSDRPLPPHAGSRQVQDERNPPDALGVYLFDAFGNLELLVRDPELSCQYPLPLRSREEPPEIASDVDWDGPQFGQFFLSDVYRGLEGVERGAIERLRIVGVTPKTQPYKNQPVLGVSLEDPGKFVLGTVPVQADGSAFFRVPSGVPLFFQALDAEGLAVQTMRSLAYVQPGETRSCVGCHEPRDLAPPAQATAALALRSPASIAPGPEGSMPLRYDRLVQPVLDRHCVACHDPASGDPLAAAPDLRPEGSYDALLAHAGGQLRALAFEKDASLVGDCVARKSELLGLLIRGDGHHGVVLDPDGLERLATWLDTYAHRRGSFCSEQEEEIARLREEWREILQE